MPVNMGGWDRAVRFVVGLALLAVAIEEPGAGRWLAVPGAIFILTAWLSFCPLYAMLHISSHPNGSHRRVEP